MVTSTQRFLLLTVGLLFCVLGCARDRVQVLMPDDISPPTEVHESADVAKASFEQNVLPILTQKCALAGCHVADGPHGLDFRTYTSFIAGGEHGSVFVPGNAEESEVVEEIVEGKMPPEGPPLPAAEIQIFVDWINQQESQDHVIQDEHGEDHDEDMDEDHDDDMDDEHGDMNGDDEDDLDEDHEDIDEDMDDDHDDDN